MAGSTGSRILWAGLLTPPLLLLATTAAVTIWPERVVGIIDAAQRVLVASPQRPFETTGAHDPMMRNPHPPSNSAPTAMLRGTIRTSDGRPYLGTYTLGVIQRGGRGHSSSRIDSMVEPRFAVPILPDTLHVVIAAEGYAPQVLGPYSAESSHGTDGRHGDPGPEGSAKGVAARDPDPVDVVLERGYPHEVRVVDEAGSPILGAEVAASLVIDRVPLKLPTSLRTDDEGRAFFSDLSQADYEFDVTVHKFRVPDDAVPAWPSPEDDSTTITLERGPASGVAMDEEGRPVADVVLLVASEMDDRLDLTSPHVFERVVLAKSDAEGRFRLPALHDDSTYLIRAEGPGGSLGFAPGVRRKAGEVKVTLRPLRTVRGVAPPDATGGPSQITLRRRVPTGFESRGSAVDWRGEMQHSRIFPAGPDGRFEYPAWGSVDTELVIGGRSIPVPWPPPDEPLRIEALPEESSSERTIRLQFISDPSIRPIRGPITLHLAKNPPERTHQDVARQVEIVKDSARFHSLASESFRYDSDAIPGYWTAPGTIPGGGPGGERSMDVRVFAAGSIAGRVVESDGAQVGTGVKVMAYFDPEWAGGGYFQRGQGMPVNPDGSRLQNRMSAYSQGTEVPQKTSEEATTGPEGRFDISAFPLNVRSRLLVERGRYFAHGEDVRLDDRDPRRELEFRVPRQAAAEVRVVDPEGRPIPGARLSVLQSRSESETRTWPFGETDADGRCSVDDLAEGETNYTVLASFAADFRPIVAPLTPGGPLLELRAERGEVIEGRVEEAVTGWPIPGVTLHARPPGSPLDVEAVTDADGRFRMSTLPAGPVRLEDRRLLHWLSPWPPIVRAGTATPIRVRFIDLRDIDPQPRPVPGF